MAQKYPASLKDAIRYFSRPYVAERLFTLARWKEGKVTCPRCGSSDVIYLGERYARWECRRKHPRRQFTVKVGTLMEDSPLNLKTWAMAFWVVDQSELSISSYELHRGLRITQKSAWFLLHRVHETIGRKDRRRGKPAAKVNALTKEHGKGILHLQRLVRNVLAMQKASTAKREAVPEMQRQQSVE